MYLHNICYVWIWNNWEYEQTENIILVCHQFSMLLKDDSAAYFRSCIFVFFIAHWNMWNNINHWHKNTQLELFLTLLSCNYNTTISIKTNISITWTLPMMSPALTSWKIDFAETTKLGGWLDFISEKYNTILWVTIYERSSQACIFIMMMQVIPWILELMGKGNTK